MSISRNFYDKSVPTRNLITTISGIALMLVSVVVSILLAMGKITTDQAQPLNEALAGIIAAVTQIATYVGSIVLMFKSTDA